MRIIVLTAGSQIALARKAMPDAFVMAKPFDLNRLFTVVDELTERARTEERQEYRTA